MKKLLFVFGIFFLSLESIMAQPRSFYYFRYTATPVCTTATVRNCQNGYLTTATAGLLAYFESFYISCLRVDYEEACGTYFDKDVSSSILNQSIGSASDGYLFYWWSPVISSIQANASGLSILSTSGGLTTTSKSISVERTINISITCDYTGDDFKWYLIKAPEDGGGRILIYTGRNFSVPAKTIADSLGGIYKRFQIKPQMPYWRDDQSGSCYKDYRDAYNSTETLQIVPGEITSYADGELECDGQFRLRIYPFQSTRIDFQAGQYINNTLRFFSIPRLTNFLTNSNNYNDVTINYSDVVNAMGSNIKQGQTFFFRAVYHDNTDIPYTKTTGGFMFFEPTSDFSIPAEVYYCEGDKNSGILSITRTNTTYAERYEFKDGITCTTGVEIDRLDLAAGVLSGTADHIPVGSYCVQSVRIDSADGIQCPSPKHYFSVIERPAPALTVVDRYSPGCTGRSDGSLVISKNPASSTLHLSSDTTTQFNPTGLSPGTFSLVAKYNGCISLSPVTAIVPSYEAISFEISGDMPSCNGYSDGEVFLNTLKGGPVGPAAQTIYTKYYIEGTDVTGNTFITSDGDTCLGKNFNGITNYKIEVSRTRNITDVCLSNTGKNITLNEPSRVAINFNTTDVTCTGGNDGSVQLSAVPGTGSGTGYRYFLQAGDHTVFPVSSSGLFSLKPADTYRAWATDNVPCFSDTIENIIIDQPDSILLQSVNYESESCPNTGDGAIFPQLGIGNGVSDLSYQWLSFSNAEIPGKTDLALNNVESGNYKLLIHYNANACSTLIEGFFLPPNTGIQAFFETEPTCIEKNTGQLILNSVTNGTSPYRFFIDNIESDESPAFPATLSDDLAPGPHTLEIYDNNFLLGGIYEENCKVTKDFTINQKDLLSIETDILEPSCYNSSDGSITITSFSSMTYNPFVSGWYNSSGQVIGSGNIANNLTEGNYSVLISDEDGCETVIEGLYVDQPSQLLITGIQTDSANCIESGDGTVTVTATGGTISDSYGYSAGNGFIENNTITGLPSAEYTITVRDDNGCTADSFPVNVGARRLDIFDIHSTRSNCIESQDGEISLNASGTHTFYHRFLITGESGDRTADIPAGNPALFSNLPAGDYLLRVTDDNGCADSAYTFVDAGKLTINGLIVKDASCIEVDDGQIAVSAAGTVTTNYRYSLDTTGGNYYTVDCLDSLSEGSYTVFILDDNGCIADTSVMVGAGEVFLSLIDSLPVTCNGEQNGLVQVSASGGSVPYRYFITGEGFTNNNNIGLFTALDAGNYSMYAEDTGTGCESQVLSHSVYEPDPLEVELELMDSASCGQYTGRIEYSVTGGNGGYHLIWQNDEIGETTDLDISSLKTGMYSLTVTDSKECSNTASVDVPDRPSPVITRFDILEQTWCDLPLGSAGVHVTSGSPPYTFRWNNDAADTTQIAGQLTEGTYQVWVTDRYNCTDEGSVTLVDGPDIELTSQIDEAHCGRNDATVTFNVTGGVAPFMFRWPDSIAAEPVSDPLMNNLYAGIYTVNVMDDVGCIKPFPVNIGNLDGPSITNLYYTKSWCSLPRGSAGIDISGGTPPYSFEWTQTGNSQIIGQYNPIDSLMAGDYTIKVTDVYYCTDINSVHITDSLELQPLLNLVQYDSSSCNKPTGILSVVMNNGQEPYSFLWNTGQSAPMLKELVNGMYQVTATDGRGCRDSLSLRMEDRKLPQLFLVSDKDAYCGKPTGNAVIRASFGKAPYFAFLTTNPQNKIPFIYNIETGNYTSSIENLLPSPVSYRIRLTDSVGCESNEVSALINNSDPMVIELADISPVRCYGNSDGTVTVNVKNGFSPYSYDWSIHPVNSRINSSLPAGPFSVTVTDSMGCVKLFDGSSTPVPQPEPVSVTSINSRNPLCYGSCDGRITAYGQGGTGDLLYIWNYSDTVQTLSGLCEGTYFLAVEDGNGCSVTRSVGLTNPLPLTNTSLPETVDLCQGKTYPADPGSEWSNVYWYSPGGFSANTRVAELPGQGIYYVTAYSPAGCQVNDSIRINGYVLTQTALPESVSVCIGSSYAATPGSQWERVSWSSNTGFTGTGPVANVSDEGEYYLSAYLKTGCLVLDTLHVMNPPILSQTSLPESVTVCSGQVITADPGPEWNDVKWTGSNGFASSSPVIAIGEAGNYYMTGYSSKGCLVMDTLLLFVSDNLLNAEFLMMSGAQAGDTVVIIEVSWPPAENYTWNFPEGTRMVSDDGYIKQVVFTDAGTHLVELEATLAGCSSVQGKYIEVFDAAPPPLPGITPAAGGLITSFTAYPNPASGRIQMNIRLAREAPVRIEIISITGNTLAFTLTGNGLDEYLLPADISSLPYGMYMIRLIAANEVQTKILVVK